MTEKKWVVTLTTNADGTSKLERVNDGFNAIELLGLCEMMSGDIRAQLVGRVKPDVIERKVIENEMEEKDENSN